MRHTRHDGIRLFNPEKAVRHLFRLCTEGVLAVENVQRDNDTDQQIHQHVYGRNNAAHHVAKLRQQVILRPVHYLCGELIVQAHEAVLNFRVVVQQRRHPAGYLVHIQVHRVYQRGDTRDQLRQHHPQQHAYNRQTEGQRQRAAQAFGKPCAVFEFTRHRRLQIAVQHVEHRHKQVRHHKAVNERAEDAEKLLDYAPDHCHAEQHEHDQHAGYNDT